MSRYPKRKRTVVSYAEGNSHSDEGDEDQHRDEDDEDQGDEDGGPAKKARISAYWNKCVKCKKNSIISPIRHDPDDERLICALCSGKRKTLIITPGVSLGPPGQPSRKLSDEEIMRRKKKEFKFFEFPAEIRNQIYGYLVCQPYHAVFIGDRWSKVAARRVPQCWPTRLEGEVLASAVHTARGETALRVGNYAHSVYPMPPEESAKFSRNFGILRVCKQASEEALGIMYGQRFYFHGLFSMQNFILNTNATNLARLESIDFCWASYQNERFNQPAAFSLLRPATNIKRLHNPMMSKLSQGFQNVIGGYRRHSNMTVDDWDKLVGCNMAHECYSGMYTYLDDLVKEKGGAHVAGILDVFAKAFLDGPQRDDYKTGDYLVYGPTGHRESKIRARAPNAAVLNADWTEHRRQTMRSGIAEELDRLVARNA